MKDSGRAASLADFRLSDVVVIRSDALADIFLKDPEYQKHRLHEGVVTSIGRTYVGVRFPGGQTLMFLPNEIARLADEEQMFPHEDVDPNEAGGYDEASREIVTDSGWTAAKGGNKLRELYPHGHPKFIEIVIELAELHSNKNYDYARGGNPLGNFYRCAKMLDMDPAKYAWHLVSKQIDAVNWAFLQGGEQKVESMRDKLRDIAVYSILVMILLETQ